MRAKRLLAILLIIVLGVFPLAPAVMADEKSPALYTPVITQQPTAKKLIRISTGSTLKLSVAAVLPEGSDGQLRYQWHRAAEDADEMLEGETSPALERRMQFEDLRIVNKDSFTFEDYRLTSRQAFYVEVVCNYTEMGQEKSVTVTSEPANVYLHANLMDYLRINFLSIGAIANIGANDIWGPDEYPNFLNTFWNIIKWFALIVGTPLAIPFVFITLPFTFFKYWFL